MTAIRVLVVHNRYRTPGGEDAVVEAEIGLLRKHGHDLRTYVRDNADLDRMPVAGALAQLVWSQRTSREIDRLVTVFRPDVIHAHNTFALVSGSLYWAARRAGVPIVQTLHNFRLLCMQAMLLREGRVCEDCLGRGPWRGVQHRCYHESAVQSAALAVMLATHRALGTYRDKVTRYIALNEFCRAKFIAGGLPAERIAVKPNFVDLPPPADEPRAGGLYVGRLAPEKGIATLAAALDDLPGVTIDVLGTGPERARISGHRQMRLLGWREPEDVYARMRRAAYLVMPSLWYENHPRTLVEAFASALPVIASRIGALAELVQPGVTGLTTEPGSPRDLRQSIAWAEANPARMRAMGERARARYERELTPHENYRRLIAIYKEAIAATTLRPAT
ncbi:MAG TPA: glycosyltransferase family 4 protein [Burkholderiales bacterium]|nr:glycosyltransferase family 4 protein [Burkholderiales bacterium]